MFKKENLGSCQVLWTLSLRFYDFINNLRSFPFGAWESGLSVFIDQRNQMMANFPFPLWWFPWWWNTLNTHTPRHTLVHKFSHTSNLTELCLYESKWLHIEKESCALQDLKCLKMGMKFHQRTVPTPYLLNTLISFMPRKVVYLSHFLLSSSIK